MQACLSYSAGSAEKQIIIDWRLGNRSIFHNPPMPFVSDVVRVVVQRDAVTGSDPFIKEALPHIVFKSKLLVEPSAAIGLAAALEGNFKVRQGERICFLLSGGNIDPEKLAALIG